MRAAAAEALGAAPPIGGASYWADAAFIAAAGIPTVMLGPGGEGAHADVEWVSLADTEAVAAHAHRGRDERLRVAGCQLATPKPTWCSSRFVRT